MAEGYKDATDVANLPEPVARQEERKQGWLALINSKNAARVIKGIGHIVGKASKYSNTWSQTARENRSRDTISAAIADRIATGIKSADPRFERTFEREADRLLREQANLDDIAEIVSEDLSDKNEADFTPGELEDDWLYQFEQAAKGFSSERMKHTFARILTGEILRPGTFSPATLRVLTTLSATEAQLISTFMSMAFASSMKQISPQLFTAGLSPGNNGLEPFGLNYDRLCRLQECGFLSYDLNTNRTVAELLLTKIPAFIGNKFIRCLPLDAPNDARQIRLPGLLLTAVGAEICQVVDGTPPPDTYLSALRENFEKQHRLKLLHN